MRRLLRPSRPAPEGHLRDPLYGDAFPRLVDAGRLARFPEATGVAAALVRGDVQPLVQLIDTLDEDPERSVLVLGALLADHGSAPAVRPALDAWVQAEPGSWRALVVRGRQACALGVAAASAGAPRRVTDAWFCSAEADLVRAARIAADRVEVWTALLASCGGLEVPVAERVLRYEEVHRRSAFFPPAVFEAVLAIGQRHWGDSEEILGLARAAREQVPDGHPALAATAFAHIEATAHAGEHDTEEYFRRHEVQSDLDKAFGRWWAGVAGETGPSRHLAANAFGAAFTWAARNDEVRACVLMVGEHPEPQFWQGFALPPLDLYQMVRSRVGLLDTPARVAFRGTLSETPPPVAAVADPGPA